MTLISNLRPKFWDHADVSHKQYKHLFNFRKIWKLNALLTLIVALIPLLVMTTINYRLSRKAMESEIRLRTSRLVSNTRRSVSYFLAERKAALDFVILNESLKSLVSPGRLENVLQNLTKSFGGFVDLGVINDKGEHLAYTGPYKLFDKNYKDAVWFNEVIRRGIYISDVFMGFRNIPHMVIAVRHNLGDGGFYVIRATLDTNRFNKLLSSLEVGGEGDAFVINREGVLQTPSRYQGKLLARVGFPVPDYSETSQVRLMEAPLLSVPGAATVADDSEKGDVRVTRKPSHGSLLIGYAYIPETRFILMIVKHKDQLLQSWKQSQKKLVSFMMISMLAIIVVVLGGITYLVNQIYTADQRRLMAMHEAEYANKMASLGRLSAGVAHEINNPLAIINEKAGLIKDIFTFRKEYDDPKLMGLVDVVLSSVERCANITHRLLNFARHSDIMVKPIDLGKVLADVLSFTGKEAEYRSIEVDVDVSDGPHVIESDQGRLQEIFLNLITNALAAVKDGGRLGIRVCQWEEDQMSICFSDDGHGIPEEDIDRVFEPFFSTKTDRGGTGLGLSITYGLIHELGGNIHVKSELGKGTEFRITLPLQQVQPETSEKASPENGNIGLRG
ncbi:MAG: two-component sensor histidine kinase [Desulfobacteraceae bacterium 4572_88]|nr:MAG: two-component sensor histidine kinase [Desulfobacteraceae bacterium 4572_88]